MPALQPAHRHDMPATSGLSSDPKIPGTRPCRLGANVTSGPGRAVREDRPWQGARPPATRQGAGLAGYLVWALLFGALFAWEACPSPGLPAFPPSATCSG